MSFDTLLGIFCIWCVIWESNFVLCMLSQNHFVEKTIISPIESFSTLATDELTVNVEIYFWILNFIQLIYMFVLMPVPHCLDYCNLEVSFEIRKCKSSNFGYSRSLEFLDEFWDQPVHPSKKPAGFC